MSRVPAYLSRSLDRLDPADGSWVTTTIDDAVRAASRPREGALAGTTFAVKDLIDTAGVRTTYGSALYEDNRPAVTATIVHRLAAQGSVLLGKTNLNEFGYGVTGYNPAYGMIRSPLGAGLTAGGSSGGSAAVVGAGVVDIAIGTDTTGSVRIPAACCGVIGFKCALGSQPMDGVYPLAPSMDCLGFFVRDLDLLGLLLGVGELPDPAAVRVADGAALGLPPVPMDHVDAFRHEALPRHRERAALFPEKYGADVLAKLREPERSDLWQVTETLGRWRREYAAAAAGIDVITGPVFHGPIPTVEQVLADYASGDLTTSARLQTETAAASVLGWPAMVVPTADGSLQLTARPGGEAALLAHARQIALAPPELCHPR